MSALWFRPAVIAKCKHVAGETARREAVGWAHRTCLSTFVWNLVMSEDRRASGGVQDDDQQCQMLAGVVWSTPPLGSQWKRLMDGSLCVWIPGEHSNDVPMKGNPNATAPRHYPPAAAKGCPHTFGHTAQITVPLQVALTHLHVVIFSLETVISKYLVHWYWVLIFHTFFGSVLQNDKCWVWADFPQIALLKAVLPSNSLACPCPSLCKPLNSL